MSKKSMKQFNAKNTAPKKAVKNNKRKVAEWVLAILILIWTIGTVLGVVGFVRTLPKASAEETQSTMQLKDRNKSIYGPADSNDWYVPLDIFNGMTVFYSPSSYTFQSIFSGQVGVIFNGTSLNFVYDTYNSSGTVNRSRYSSSGAFSLSNRIIRDGAFYISSSFESNFVYFRPEGVDFDDGWYLSNYITQFYFDESISALCFDINFYFNQVGNTAVAAGRFEYTIFIPSSYTYSRIFIPLTSQTFTDTGEVYSVKWSESIHYQDMNQMYDNGFNSGYTDGFTDGESQGYNDGFSAGETQGYNNGYNVGKADGFTDGESQGYNNGFSAGETQGYNNGYNVGKADGFTDGVANANEYSFAGLLGSVVDVPVNAFKSLFNFEILGVNLSSFLMALLTIMIILAVTKLFI